MMSKTIYRNVPVRKWWRKPGELGAVTTVGTTVQWRGLMKVIGKHLKAGGAVELETRRVAHEGAGSRASGKIYEVCDVVLY